MTQLLVEAEEGIYSFSLHRNILFLKKDHRFLKEDRLFSNGYVSFIANCQLKQASMLFKRERNRR